MSCFLSPNDSLPPTKCVQVNVCTYNPWVPEAEKMGNLDLSMALRWCPTAPPGATRNRAEQ